MVLPNISHKCSQGWFKALDGLDLDGVLHVDSFLNLWGKMFKEALSCFDNAILVTCRGWMCYIVEYFMGLRKLWWISNLLGISLILYARYD